MKYVIATAIFCAGYWVAVVLHLSSKPHTEIRRTYHVPAAEKTGLQLDCREALRACKARIKSAQIGGEK